MDALPADIAQSLPKLQALHLDNCKRLLYLPMSLGSLKHLKSLSVATGCTSLLYPPKSQRSNAAKTAKYLRSVVRNSDIWRRLKVRLRPRADSCSLRQAG